MWEEVKKQSYNPFQWQPVKKATNFVGNSIWKATRPVLNDIYKPKPLGGMADADDLKAINPIMRVDIINNKPTTPVPVTPEQYAEVQRQNILPKVKKIIPSVPSVPSVPIVSTPVVGFKDIKNTDQLKKIIVGAESSGGDENVFKKILAGTAPWRLKLENDANKYGDAGQFGWVIGLTIPTYLGIVEHAKTDKRYKDLLGKIDLTTKEGAINSALHILDFKNTKWNEKGEAIGKHYNNAEDAYVERYNASGAGKSKARSNWRLHAAKFSG